MNAKQRGFLVVAGAAVAASAGGHWAGLLLGVVAGVAVGDLLARTLLADELELAGRAGLVAEALERVGVLQ